MKPSGIYTRAAKSIAEKEEYSCCNAIGFSSQELINEMRGIYYDPNHSANYNWMSDKNELEFTNWRPLGRLHRSLALLFMAEIMKDGGY